ncbi:MAG: B12-binding domain-containing radical SAM protein [Bacteroidia bacterium]|nr:B12-binding domain-containing radical SAM protein [Bacteroidia bacterium]
MIKKPLKGEEEIYLGISYISAVLKKSGHNTQLAVLDRKYKNRNFKTITHKITFFQPDIICFTSVNSEFDFIENIAAYIKLKYPKILLILGGVHATINPNEELFKNFDALCTGEGEYPILELVDAIEKNKNFSNLNNLWLKLHNGNIKINPNRPFIENLDNLPFPDREIWQEWILERNTRISILLGRGCPFNCTYCCNHKQRKVAEGNYVRLRSEQNILSEINELHTQFPEVKEYFLEIETLCIDMEWFIKLCKMLEESNRTVEKKISFSANLRIVPKMNFEQIFSNLKKANFDSVTIGIESGCERLRSEILKRSYSNDDIRQAASTAKKYGIKTGIFNMIGIPAETYSDFQETLKLNQEIQPDWHSTSIFVPYKGTELYEFTKNNGLLPKNMNYSNERQKAVLDLPGFSKKKIQKCFDSFHFNVYKKTPDKNFIKYSIYFLQKFTGHDFMANIKIVVIKILWKLKLNKLARKFNLLTVFQKS